MCSKPRSATRPGNSSRLWEWWKGVGSRAIFTAPSPDPGARAVGEEVLASADRDRLRYVEARDGIHVLLDDREDSRVDVGDLVDDRNEVGLAERRLAHDPLRHRYAERRVVLERRGPQCRVDLLEV